MDRRSFLLVSALLAARAEAPETCIPKLTETFPDKGIDNETQMEGYVQRLFGETPASISGARATSETACPLREKWFTTA